jgi:periplasmic nitrate reductase NapD
MTNYAPTRRAVLEGRLASRQPQPAQQAMLHISSAVVTVLPAHREAILQQLAAVSGVEVHHAGEFKIVVVLETTDTSEIGARLLDIGTWTGVLSANLVFEQSERLAETGG